jgi:hypothetical protein
MKHPFLELVELQGRMIDNNGQMIESNGKAIVELLENSKKTWGEISQLWLSLAFLLAFLALAFLLHFWIAH